VSDEPEPAASLGWSTRFAFGVGALGEGTILGAAHVFLLFYYNHVLGLPGSLAGAALGVATVVDAVTDPLVGSLSDGTRSRWGRRHPFMYGAVLPSALLFYLLFNPPTGLGETTLFLWLTLTASGARAALTLFSIPHMSLGAELSTDYDERTRLASVRGFFRQAGTLTVALVGFGVFFQAGNGYENGQLNPAAYPPFSLFIVVCVLTTLLMSAAGTQSRIPLLPRALDTHERFRWVRLLREIRDAARIRSFRYMILSLLTYNSIMGMHGALALYVVTFFWVVSPTEIMFITPAVMFGNVVGASLGSMVTKRIGEKRSAAMLGIAWYAAWSSSMPTLRLLDLAPLRGDPWLVPWIVITGILGGLGMGVAIVAKNAMLADVTDEHEWRYGVRQEGIYFSSYLFAEKAVSGVGIVLAGLALELLGLESSATPENVPAGVVQGLGILFGPATFGILFVPIALLLGYNITRARHAEIRQALEAAARPSSRS
jgi:Na+/melibiose symporter-like transporter